MVITSRIQNPDYKSTESTEANKPNIGFCQLYIISKRIQSRYTGPCVTLRLGGGGEGVFAVYSN